MSGANLAGFYILVRTTSSRRTKPNIKTACRLIPYVEPLRDPSYDWSEAEATNGTATWTVWAGIPHNSEASCRILNCSDVADEELTYTIVNTIASKWYNELRSHNRVGGISWDAGNGVGASAYMVVTEMDSEEELNVWWDIVYVDVDKF